MLQVRRHSTVHVPAQVAVSTCEGCGAGQGRWAAVGDSVSAPGKCAPAESKETLDAAASAADCTHSTADRAGGTSDGSGSAAVVSKESE